MSRIWQFGSMNSLRLMLRCAVCYLLVSWAPLSMHGQVLYGTLTGTVTDPTGAAIASAQVTASQTQTGVSQTATSDTTGIYRFTALPPGTYKVTIAASGFATQETNNVPVNRNEVARVDAQLKVANASQNVTVTTEAPILQTDKADVHTDLTAQQIESLPDMGSQGRNFQRLLEFVPGGGLQTETNSLAGNPQRAINVNFNGQSNQSTNTRLDGVQDSYPYLPANVAYVPPADAIQNVNVVTNSFDAEQGNAGGAAVNVQIKSGTNEFHGGAHEYYTSQLFASRNYFQTDHTIFPHKNKNIQQQFGGNLGGPILKDKLFFFGDYERTTQRQLAGPDTVTLPTAAMATGDFRNLPGNPVIYDPTTGNAQGAGKTQISCNGVLNVICPNRIDPAASTLVQLLQPSIAKEFATGNDLGNFQGSGTALFNRDDADFKIDYHPGAKSTVFGRYSFSRSLAVDPPLLGAAVGNATNGGQLGNAPGLVQNVGLGTTYAFTPNLLLDLNFGFTRQRLGGSFALTSPQGLNDLHIPGTNNAGTVGNPSQYYGLPGFIFNTGQAGSGTGNQIGTPIGNASPANPFLFRDQQWVSGANLTWIKGKHNLRGGIEWNHAQINHFQPQGGTLQSPRGVFGFNGDVTSLLGTTPSWFNSFADFLLGLPSVTGKAYQSFNPNAMRWSSWAWYGQDRWQATSKLTLTLGVRWEYYPFGYKDNGGGIPLLNLHTGNVTVGGFGGVPQNDNVDVGIGQFLPRAGLAYRLTSSTVIRAGYGMSEDPYTWHTLLNAYPSNILVTNVPANTANFIPAASLTGLNGTGLGGGSYSVPTGIVLTAIPNTSSGSIPLPTNIGTTTFANPVRRGYINSFNLMVEQDFKGFVFQTGYVGSRAIRPVVNINANPSAPGTGSKGGVLSTALGNNYTGTINELTPFKNNYYDSLQTTVTRRFANGSTAGFIWTWSKTIDYADNEDLGFVPIPYAPDLSKDRALSGFDRTHNIEIYGVLALPFGRGQRWVTSGLGSRFLGGWQLSPVVKKLSGVPFTVGAGGNLNANGSGQTADLVGPFHILNGRPPRTGVTCAQTDLSCHYFDAGVFAAPLITSSANAHFGNTNRNEFRGPGYFETDLSLSREFSLTERFKLQVRADAFNLTNTPHFGNPNASCPASAAAPGSIPGEGGLCNTGSNNNFGVITGILTPGGFFGPDPGTRSIWFGASLTF